MELLGNLEQQAQHFLAVLQSDVGGRSANTRAAAAAAAFSSAGAGASSSAQGMFQEQQDVGEEERCGKLLADIIVEVARWGAQPCPRGSGYCDRISDTCSSSTMVLVTVPGVCFSTGLLTPLQKPVMSR